MTDSLKPPRVTAGEIADLLARGRSLSEQGRHADPQQRAAYQAAKAEVLARITGEAHHIDPAEGGEA